MPVPTLDRDLNNRLGLHIRAICDCSYSDDHQNHCAHFVSHVMEYRFGFKCRDMTGRGTGLGANIRVHEIFSRCANVGEWADKPAGNCLAFVTASSNVNLAHRTMANVPAKHIGIFCNNLVYHYSNSRRHVVSQTVDAFGRHYSGSNIKVYYGTFI